MVAIGSRHNQGLTTRPALYRRAIPLSHRGRLHSRGYMLPRYPSVYMLPRYPSVYMLPRYPSVYTLPRYPSVYMLPHYPSVYMQPRYPSVYMHCECSLGQAEGRFLTTWLVMVSSDSSEVVSRYLSQVPGMAQSTWTICLRFNRQECGYFHEKGKVGSWQTQIILTPIIHWLRPLLFLPWCSEATLLIWNEGWVKAHTRKTPPPEVRPAVRLKPAFYRLQIQLFANWAIPALAMNICIQKLERKWAAK